MKKFIFVTTLFISNHSFAETYTCEIASSAAGKFPQHYVEIDTEEPRFAEVQNTRTQDGHIFQHRNLQMAASRVNRINGLKISDERCDLKKSNSPSIFKTTWACGSLQDFSFKSAEGFIEVNTLTKEGRFSFQNWHPTENAWQGQSWPLHNCNRSTIY